MLLIYTTSATPRLRYTMDLIFRELLGTEYSITQDEAAFSYHTGPKFSYSTKPVGNELFFFSTPLLFEKKIRNQDLTVFDWENTKAFFATHPKYVFPFDPFAASFYMVTRYEEYLPFEKDSHGRFDARVSLASQKGFLQKPVVNIYAEAIKKTLLSQFPQMTFRKNAYRFIPTIDVDNAWAYKEKGIIRTGGAILRSLTQLQFREFAERLAVLADRQKDPYDTYNLFFDIQRHYSLKPLYFFLLGDYAENDKNVSPGSKKLHSLIKSISDYCEIGLHPSYASNNDPSKLLVEKQRLQRIIRREITRSRQHFLKLTFPFTYRTLIDHDITDDYTMGFSGEIGFRAGICVPFYFYDLENETQTRLRIHPFCVMDATLKYYMKVHPAEVMSYVGPLIKEIRAVNGTCTILWHNESISGKKPWEGWQDVYEEIVKAAV